MYLTQHQRGFTLVEVMVTVFVVAIGLLSAAALQVVSKKAAFDAIQRTTASVVAQDMLERIRGNPTQLSSYGGKTVNSASVPATPSCGSSSDCTEAALVGYDLYRWWQSLDGVSEQIASGSTTTNGGGLRSPTGCIRLTGNQVEVIVAWRGMSSIQQGDSSNTDDPTNDTCGATLADYEPSSGNSYRRVLRLQAHIGS